MDLICAWCGEAIAEGSEIEQGPLHFECGLRSALGSIGHQKKACSCYGGQQEDPPGMTRRQAAAAAALYHYFGKESAS